MRPPFDAKRWARDHRWNVGTRLRHQAFGEAEVVAISANTITLTHGGLARIIHYRPPSGYYIQKPGAPKV